MTQEIVDKKNGGGGEPISFRSPEFDNDKYSMVARLAQLQDVCLTKSTYDIKRNFFFEAEHSDKELLRNYTGRMLNADFDMETGLLIGGYSWSALVKFGRKNALKINCEYMVVYSGLEDADSEYTRLYFQKIARFTSYPYFRAHFATHVAASGLNLGPLPSLNDRVD